MRHRGWVTSSPPGPGLPSPGSDVPGAVPGHRPHYSSAADVAQRLNARDAGRSRWEGSDTSFGILGRILFTLPVLLVCLGLLYIGVRYTASALVLLLVVAGGIGWYIRQVWLRR